jgi:hypothetical protein
MRDVRQLSELLLATGDWTVADWDRPLATASTVDRRARAI